MSPPLEPKHYRAIWLSDIHLGTRGCKAEYLLDFLRHHESEYLYLVGDIIDGWKLKKSWYWLQSHSDVVQKILRKARKGTKIYYVPGNHDEFIRNYIEHWDGEEMLFGGITILKQTEHTTADGRRLLIMHGDQFDGVVNYAKWLAHIGDWAYEVMMTVNHGFNWVRRKLGYSYWSLSAYLKHKVKNAVNFISDYEDALADEAKRHGYDGIVCGHIHRAEIREINGVLYCNDGDWVESCTALVEDWQGNLSIIKWADEDQKQLLFSEKQEA